MSRSHIFKSSFALGHQYKLRRLQSKELAGIQSFSQRVVTDWNSLPEEVVQTRTLNEFKARIDEHGKDEQYVTPFDSSKPSQHQQVL